MYTKAKKTHLFIKWKKSLNEDDANIVRPQVCVSSACATYHEDNNNINRKYMIISVCNMANDVNVWNMLMFYI